TIGSQGLLARFQDIDIRLLETIKHLQGSEDRRPLDQDLVALPTRLGGLGIPLYAEVAELAFQNSQAIADITLQRILPPKLFWRLPRAPSPAPSNTSNLQEDGLEGDIDKATEEDTQGLDEQTTLGSQEQEQDTQQQPSFPLEHQQLDPTSTGPARTIYRAAIDKLNRARLARVQQKLSLQQENVRIENSAFLGRRWLSAMPTSQPLLLSDMDARLPSEAGPGIIPVFKDYAPYYRWTGWRTEHPVAETEIARQQILQLVEQAKEADDGTGQWVAILGFSQGAGLAATQYPEPVALHEITDKESVDAIKATKALKAPRPDEIANSAL
ncbi:unnamed protein product, partial [Aureobasidium vineae]